MQERVAEMRRVAQQWRKRFKVKGNSWDSHDFAHAVSGYPPTEKGEAQQAGWEKAIMGIGIDYKLSYSPSSDEELQGWLAGYEFRQSNPELANFVEFCLTHMR